MQDTDLGATDLQDQEQKKGIVDNARETLGQVFDMVQNFLGIKNPTVDFAKYILKESLAQLAGVVKTIADGLTDTENKLDDHKEFSTLYKTFRLLKGLAEGVEKFEKEGVISAIMHIYGAIKEMFEKGKDEKDKEDVNKVTDRGENLQVSLQEIGEKITTLSNALEANLNVNIKHDQEVEGPKDVQKGEQQLQGTTQWRDKFPRSAHDERSHADKVRSAKGNEQQQDHGGRG